MRDAVFGVTCEADDGSVQVASGAGVGASKQIGASRLGAFRGWGMREIEGLRRRRLEPGGTANAPSPSSHQRRRSSAM